MLSDIFSFSFTLFLPNWLLISIRIYSGIARFPCDSMAFLLEMNLPVVFQSGGGSYRIKSQLFTAAVYDKIR